MFDLQGMTWDEDDPIMNLLLDILPAEAFLGCDIWGSDLELGMIYFPTLLGSYFEPQNLPNHRVVFDFSYVFFASKMTSSQKKGLFGCHMVTWIYPP